MKKNCNFACCAVALALTCAVGSVFATEGGGSTYPSGVENFMSGAVPPPGFYILGYANAYQADKFRDGGGNDFTPPGFKASANVAVGRFIWSTPIQVLGGNVVNHVIAPVVNLKVSAFGLSQTKNGLGDVTIGSAVAWHHSPSLHSVGGANLVLPTGGYKTTDLANIGRNYWSVQPTYAVTLVNSSGLNADAKVTLNFNSRNSATNYRSGTEIFVDYALGWGLGNGWVLGVGGHVRDQFNSDTLNGAAVAGSKTKGFAIGPSVKYDTGKGFLITAKWQKESSVRNGTEGSALWVKTVIPF